MNKEAHLELLVGVRCDVSQHMGWRKRLFENPDHTKFEITPESVVDEFPSLAQKMRSSNLRFIVEKENGNSADAVVFRFYLAMYPEYAKVSFNNPHVS